MKSVYSSTAFASPSGSARRLTPASDVSTANASAGRDESASTMSQASDEPKVTTPSASAISAPALAPWTIFSR